MRQHTEARDFAQPPRSRVAGLYLRQLRLNVLHLAFELVQRRQLLVHLAGAARSLSRDPASIQRDKIVKTWSENKVKPNSGRNKQRIVVALMRKLSRALWHLARGHSFDARRLCAVG